GVDPGAVGNVQEIRDRRIAVAAQRWFVSRLRLHRRATQTGRRTFRPRSRQRRTCARRVLRHRIGQPENTRLRWCDDVVRRISVRTGEVTMSKESGTITRQREGHVLRAFGEEVIVYLDGEHTSGKLAMWTNITPPGGGSPPHYHSNEDETFYVLEGRVAFLADGQWRENSTFKNVGDQP